MKSRVCSLLILVLGFSAPVSAQVTDLYLDVPLDGSAGDGQSTFYRLSVAGPIHLVLTLQNHKGSSRHTMYIQRDELPTPDSYLASSTEDRPEQVIEMFNLQAGTYYVMVRGSSTYWGAGYTILARTAEQLPTLVPGEPLDDGVSDAQSRYYRIEATTPIHLVLTLQNHKGSSRHT
ncbi:MAG TPA: hypothetical protein PKK06_16275, partial [Phycisphaerae bacterium]|nr:hypothetical protein [Phycisphaerae bacterium]HNU46205.1 hypothetical protein [Phycisphaerae bacterium]